MATTLGRRDAATSWTSGNPARHSCTYRVGVTPARSRNSRTRWEWSANPQAAATSEIRTSDDGSCPVRTPGDQQAAPPPGTAARARRWSAASPTWSAEAGPSRCRRLQPVSSARVAHRHPAAGRGSGAPRRGPPRGRAAYATASRSPAASPSTSAWRSGPRPRSRRGVRAARRGRAPRASSSAVIRLVSSERGAPASEQAQERRAGRGRPGCPAWWPANAVSTAPSCDAGEERGLPAAGPPGPRRLQRVGPGQDQRAAAPCGASRRRRADVVA